MQVRTKLSFFLSFLLLVLTACFEYDATVHIEKNGSGRAEFAYRIPHGLVDKTDLQGKVPLTEKDVDARYRMRAGVTQYRSEIRDLPKFREVRIFVEFNDISSLSERGNTFSYGIEGAHRVFRIELDKHGAGVPKTDQEKKRQKVVRRMLDKFKITYKVYLPEKIDQSNAQKVEWNAATWEIPLSVFLSGEKNLVELEAKTKVGLWERLKHNVGKILG